MRWNRSLIVLLALGAVALPVVAGIKAMTLPELMELTQDTMLVTILDKTTEPIVVNEERWVFTKMTVAGESLRTGEAVSTDLHFWGSHDPTDRFTISEMPTLQDTRVGTRVVVFTNNDDRFDGRTFVNHLAAIFRVESAFQTEVVMGKGEGAAVSKNAKLSDVRTQVRDTHIILEAARQASAAQAK